MKTPLKLLNLGGLLAVLATTASAVTTQISIQPRSGGPFAGVNISGSFVDSHANKPSITWTVSVTNWALDKDGAPDDSFTFDLTAMTTNGNGVSIWGQGTNNSNNPGDNTSFGNLDGVSFTVDNIVGLTSTGRNISFDGFVGATAGSGNGLEVNRSVEINGTRVDMLDTNFSGYSFVQAGVTFAPTSTVTFGNQGGAAGGDDTPNGTLVARIVDVQFSTVPEGGSSWLILGLAGMALAAVRKAASHK